MNDSQVSALMAVLYDALPYRRATPEISSGLIDISTILFNTVNLNENWANDVLKAANPNPSKNIAQFIVELDTDNHKLLSIKKHDSAAYDAFAEYNIRDTVLTQTLSQLKTAQTEQTVSGYRYIRPLWYDYQINKITHANAGGVALEFVWHPSTRTVTVAMAVCCDDDNFEKETAKQILNLRQKQGKVITFPAEYFEQVYGVTIETGKELFSGNMLISAITDFCLVYNGRTTTTECYYMAVDTSIEYLRDHITDMVALSDEMDNLIFRATSTIDLTLDAYLSQLPAIEFAGTKHIKKLANGYADM